MKIKLSEVRNLVQRLLSEAVCPDCGNPNAYIGLHDVECPNPSCKFYSTKQQDSLEDTWVCPHCGGSFPAKDVGHRCPGCGENARPEDGEDWTCEHCDAHNLGEEPVCGACGRDRQETMDEPCPECGRAYRQGHRKGCSYDDKDSQCSICGEQMEDGRCPSCEEAAEDTFEI